jgi:hypothetical protein
VFLLYAIACALVVGLFTGGSLSRLGDMRFRWAAAVPAGMAVQLALFSTPIGGALGPAAPVLYIGSTLLVLAAVAANLDLRGMKLVLAGGVSNLIAIVANGGYMPVSPGALAAMGRTESTGYSNSRLVEDVRLAPLTDIFAMPAWLPAANVFSVGDILIGVGAAILVVTAMHRRASEAGAPPATGAAAH